MPHGVNAIKKHLQEVDNVPLLVSLYTDATPDTINQMVHVFQDYGEVVLSVGSSYRELNQQIFNSSDVAVSVGCVPGDSRAIPAHLLTVLDRFPTSSAASLTKADMWLHFRLVGLSTAPLLQHSGLKSTHVENGSSTNDLASCSLTPASMPAEVRLSALLDGIRTGRIFLLHAVQCIAVAAVCCCSLAVWSLVAAVVPISAPPFLPPNTIIIFVCLYLPVLLIAVLLGPSPNSVLKSTPRKNVFMRRDEAKFIRHLILRCGFVVASTFIFAWVAKGSLFATGDEHWYHPMVTYTRLPQHTYEGCTANFWLLQDLVSCELLLHVIVQVSTMLERGQKLSAFPRPHTHMVLYGAVAFVLGVHALFVSSRAMLRSHGHDSNHHCELRHQSNNTVTVVGGDGISAFVQVSWVVYLLMVALPSCGVLASCSLNDFDRKSYTRYLQFLRLEFDTRLGMHSPR